MIALIQNFLQKHHKWFFTILLAVVIVAFVFTIGNMGAGGPVERQGPVQNFYGYDLSNPNVRENLQQATVLSLLVDGRFFPNMPQTMLEQQTKVRAVLLYLADRLSIPSPDQEAFSAFVQTRPMFMGPDGNFQPAQMQQLLDVAQQRFGMPEAFVNQTLNQDWRIEQAFEALAGPGYVLPWEARNTARQQQTTWDIQVASLDLADYEPEVEIDEEGLAQYFRVNDEAYEIPPQWTVEYLFFPASDYLEEVEEPTEEAVERFYSENPSLFRPGGANETPPLDEVRGQVVAALKQRMAVRRAAFAADTFISHLFDEQIAKGSPQYQTSLEQEGLEPQPIPVFSRQVLPENTPVPPRALAMAFQLTPDQWYSDAIPTQDGAVVLLYESVEPARIPELEEVREQVVADYRETLRRESFLQEGQTIAAALQAVAGQGGSFTDVAEEMNLSVESFEDFQIIDPPEDLNPALIGPLLALQKGEVSGMEMVGESAFYLYVQEKDVPELAPDGEEVAQARQSFALTSRNMTASAILRQMVEAGEASIENQLALAEQEAAE